MSKAWFLLCLITSPWQQVLAADFRWDLEWYNSSRYSQRNEDSLIDPTGRRLGGPKLLLETDLRFNTKLSFNRSRLIVRPRLVGVQEQFRYENPSEDRSVSNARATLPEAYFEADLSKKWTVALGLQNYQWGPAEFISPSNPFYHFNAGQRAYNYKEPGKNLIRLNWSPNANWSVIGIAEPVDNGDPFWVESRSFTPKGLVKVERRGKNSLNYIGLAAGVYEELIPFLGEYASYEIFQGFSVYVDARQSKGSAQYEPEFNAGLWDMVYEKDLEAWNSLVTTGVRFESRVDIRLEYIFNSYGMNHEDQVSAFTSAVSIHPRGNSNLRKILRSGRELIGLHYGYTSIRIPDFIRDNNTLSFRYFHSLMDHSGVLQMAADFAIGDAYTLFVETGGSQGDSTQELSAFERFYGLLGLKWNL